MRKLFAGLVVAALSAFVISGCGGVRKNVAYFPGAGGTKLPKSIKAVILPVADQRESAKIYPKQIISHTSYRGEKSFDINDRPIDRVFEEALSVELYNLGVGLIRGEAKTPLDKQTREQVKYEVNAVSPEATVAIGLKVTDFMASSKRNLTTTDVKFVAAIELYVLDLRTGDLIWSDYKTEQTDTVMSAGRNYMVDKLDEVLADVMKKAVRNNLSLRDALVKSGSR